MGLPRFSYNSRNLDLSEEMSEVDWQPVHEVNGNDPISGGTRETLNRRLDIFVRLAVDMAIKDGAADDDLKAELRRLETWAQQGNAFSFARDRDEVVDTTIDANAAAGATSVSVASATGITDNKLYVLRNDTKFALVKVSSVVSTTVNFTPALDFAFLSGATFRSEQFWNLKLDRSFLGGLDRMVVEVPPLHWSLRMLAIEAR